MKKLLFVALSMLFIVVSSCNKNVSYNKEYCNEIRSIMLDMLSKQIHNDSLCIAKMNERNEFLESINYTIQNKDIATKLCSMEEEINKLSKVKLDNSLFENYRMELLKEYYPLKDDKELNNFIDTYHEYEKQMVEMEDESIMICKKVKVEL